jgi:ParB family transcriptional regulator, chromosome partitioning protein
MATTETYVPNQLYIIPLAEILPDPNQPRKYFDPAALDELTASIAQNNVMVPIFFRVETGLKYSVAGERRCAAARKAGLTTIPAIYIETPNYAAISLIENMVRADLTPVEEAEALDRLMHDHSYQQVDLARIVSKSDAYISETLSLAKLPKEIRDECRKDPLVPKKTLLAIARKKQQRSMLTAYQQYKEGLTPRKSAEAGEKPSATQNACKAMDAAMQKIKALVMQSLSQEEKDNLVAVLDTLKQAVEEARIAATEKKTSKKKLA